jgi:hypothetical protein
MTGSMTHVEELVGVVSDRPCCHSDHVYECDESHPSPRDVMLTMYRWVYIGNIHLMVSLVLTII